MHDFGWFRIRCSEHQTLLQSIVWTHWINIFRYSMDIILSLCKFMNSHIDMVGFHSNRRDLNRYFYTTSLHRVLNHRSFNESIIKQIILVRFSIFFMETVT
jgi:hypothetical protein